MTELCKRLYALALEPIAETKADTISFGFRRGRSAKDACEQIFCVLARKCSPTWLLEGDIKGCFDNINHEWLQSNIPMDKRIMKQFLKSGFIYEGKTISRQKQVLHRAEPSLVYMQI
jgi:RNA-directed DNA polymerase